MAENKGYYIEATEILENEKVMGYKVTIPENPGCEAFCKKIEDIISTGCGLKKKSLKPVNA
ncbi:MAG: hypothetical protein LUI87_07605 [Lachnospiraceae bacterium]|nr:hypothetical protein [Lachnospiraceae bacterium]